MISALLALLVPPAPMDGGTGVDRQPQQTEAGATAVPPGFADAGGFAQLLARHQTNIAAQTPANRSAEPKALAGVTVQAVVSAAQSAPGSVVRPEENSLLALRMLAAARSELTPIQPNAQEAQEQQAPENVAAVEKLPEIDPTSAFSLMPAPIAYTSDAEVAAVVVEPLSADKGPVVPEAKAAFSLLSDLAPAAGEQRLNLTPLESADAPADVSLVPPQPEDAPKQPSVVQLPEVDVPAQQQVSMKEQALVPQEVVLPQQEILPQKEALPPQPDTEMADNALPQQDAALQAGAVPAQGGPFVDISHNAEDAELLARGLQDGVAPKPSSSSPHAPSGSGVPREGTDFQQGGQQGKQSQDNPGQQEKPASLLPSAATKPEASLKPDAVKSDDFAGLLSDRMPPQPTHLAPGHPPQATDHTRDIPLVRFSHAQPHLPLEEQVSVHIKQAVAEGVDEVNIKLNPPELGKLHIKMEIAQDGRAHVVVTADSKDTFDLLRGDARGLQQALSDAGVKTDSGSLQFNLREQPGQQAMAQFEFNQQQQNGQSGQQAGQAQEGDENSLIASAEKSEVALSLHQQEGEHVLSVTRGVDIHV